MRFNAGDIVIYPMGDANILSSAPGMRGLPDLQEYARPKDRPLPIVTRLDNDGADYCHLICGYFGCDARPFNPLLEALPRMLLSQMSATAQGWLSNMLRVAAEEAGRGGAGSESLLAKLAELMFVEVVRQYITHLPDDSKGWISGLKHRHVGHALRLIHGHPHKPWTLAELAREVGLSRSVFAGRFAHYVGVSPMHYLGRWRMQLAIRYLGIPGVSVAQAGAAVGYESEAAFNRLQEICWRAARFVAERQVTGKASHHPFWNSARGIRPWAHSAMSIVGHSRRFRSIRYVPLAGSSRACRAPDRARYAASELFDRCPLDRQPLPPRKHLSQMRSAGPGPLAAAASESIFGEWLSAPPI